MNFFSRVLKVSKQELGYENATMSSIPVSVPRDQPNDGEGWNSVRPFPQGGTGMTEQEILASHHPDICCLPAEWCIRSLSVVLVAWNAINIGAISSCKSSFAPAASRSLALPPLFNAARLTMSCALDAGVTVQAAEDGLDSYGQLSVGMAAISLTIYLIGMQRLRPSSVMFSMCSVPIIGGNQGLALNPYRILLVVLLLTAFGVFSLRAHRPGHPCPAGDRRLRRVCSPKRASPTLELDVQSVACKVLQSGWLACTAC